MGPLEGYKIIEVSGIGPGPLAGMLLADLGAEVIRIDRFETDMPSPPANLDITGRNKKSIRLNLKTDKGREIFFNLLSDADALIEGFRPGVMEKLGIGPEECLKKNPKLVNFSSEVSDSGEGRWTIKESIDLSVPIPSIYASISQRFNSKNKNSFSGKILSAMRNAFGGHTD